MISPGDRQREIAERFAEVRGRVDDAARRSGRTPAEITLVVVTKTFPLEDLLAAAAAGATDVGENRVQEGESKRPGAADRPLRWHLIGPLQSNKVRRALEVFDVIHTVDSVAKAERIDRIARELGRAPVPVLLEINLGGEATKAGVAPAGAEELALATGELSGLAMRGLMAIPPASDSPADVRPWVVRLGELRDQIRRNLPAESARGFVDLSIGMSSDYEPAIEAGATIVRVGSAIFGSRPA